MNVKEKALGRAEISEMILEFYRVQPQIDSGIMDLFEDFIFTIDSFYIESVEQWNILKQESNIDLIELADIINGYVNFIGEEHNKIFKRDNKIFKPPFYISANKIEYIQFLESLKAWNAFESDNISVNKYIIDVETLLYEEKNFENEFIILIDKILVLIHAEMMILIDDLI